MLLFGALVFLQFLTWRSVERAVSAIAGVNSTVSHYGCGTRTYPCHVTIRD